jgi:RNA polymerase sigma-70 factor (ECF subfamily)
MSNGYKTVFKLYAVEGYNHKEIGEKLGITESTSKSQYTRAKVKLKYIMGYKPL